jgi:multiple sugar transport system substrate-binding protein
MVATAQRYSELHSGVNITWEKRSLQEFAGQPLDQLAERYDLLVIDHPWVGFAARAGWLLPLDEYLPATFLDDQVANSVGPSARSYSFGGHQWALAIDTATPVASWRPDLMAGSDLPRSWSDLLKLASAGKVIMPGIPVDTLMNFFMLCSTLGEDVAQSAERVVSTQVGVPALAMLRELALALDQVFFDLNPIRVYEAMTRADRFAYCPFAYGYNNYSRDGYARRPIEFGDLVEIDGRPCRTTLGGAGLAISRRCVSVKAAVDYAAFVADSVCQRTLYFESGGQPGHRAVWTDERVNLACRNFFINTLPALDRAFLRPRYPGYLRFQVQAGAPIRDYLHYGGDERMLLERLDSLYRESRKEEQPCGHSLA